MLVTEKFLNEDGNIESKTYEFEPMPESENNIWNDLFCINKPPAKRYKDDLMLIEERNKSYENFNKE